MSESNGNTPQNRQSDNAQPPEQTKHLLVVSKDGTVRPSENITADTGSPAPEKEAAPASEKPPQPKTGFAAAAPNNPEPAGNLMSESKNTQPLVTPVVVKQSSGRAVADGRLSSDGSVRYPQTAGVAAGVSPVRAVACGCQSGSGPAGQGQALRQARMERQSCCGDGRSQLSARQPHADRHGK